MGKLIIKNKYGQTPNELLNNKDISLKAKGLFGFLQCKPQNWRFSNKRISLQLKEGTDSIRNTLQELEKAGYLERQALRENGQWAGYNYILNDSPSYGFPVVREVHSTISQEAISNKEYSKKEYSNKENTMQSEDCVIEPLTTEWSYDNWLTSLLESKRVNCHIIGLFFNYKKIKFENKKQANAQFKRFLRPATQLEGYDDERLLRTFKFTDKDSDYDRKYIWGLETVLKFIDTIK